MEKVLILRKSWRSEVPLIIIFAVGCIASVVLSNIFPFLVLKGNFLKFGNFIIDVELPLLWFIPAAALGGLLIRIFDAKYVLDSTGIEAWTGILSLNQDITRVRYSDIRGADVQMNVWGRMLNFGNIEIGTAASSGWEIKMKGIKSPTSFQRLILSNRDKDAKRVGNIHSDFD